MKGKKDDGLNEELDELIVQELMKSLVEEEGLPQDRVERALDRFRVALRQQAENDALKRLRNERGKKPQRDR